MDDRAREIEANLRDVRSRIESACAAVGRDPAGVSLVVVTKTWPADDVLRLARLGVTDVGENRDQEAAAKHAAVAVDATGLTWHFIGQAQRNKARSIVRYADVIHSVDRSELVAALDRAAGTADRLPTVLVQVSLDAADQSGGRAGVAAAAADALADEIAAAPHLTLGGVMGVAPLGGDPRDAFERLAEIHARIKAAHPGAWMISAGMSGDLEDAIACGATHVRVGGAVLGSRPPVR